MSIEISRMWSMLFLGRRLSSRSLARALRLAGVEPEYLSAAMNIAARREHPQELGPAPSLNNGWSISATTEPIWWLPETAWRLASRFSISRSIIVRQPLALGADPVEYLGASSLFGDWFISFQAAAVDD
jgi:hypothetical protein